MGKILPSEFGKRLSSLRHAKGETQEETAAAAGHVTVKTYRSWELHNEAPGAYHLFLLAEHFGVDIDYLLGRIENTTHILDVVCEYTGLSEAGAKVLHDLAHPLSPLDSSYIYLHELIEKHGSKISSALIELNSAIAQARYICNKPLDIEGRTELLTAADQVKRASFNLSEACRDIPELFGAKTVLAQIEEKDRELKTQVFPQLIKGGKE